MFKGRIFWTIIIQHIILPKEQIKNLDNLFKWWFVRQVSSLQIQIWCPLSFHLLHLLFLQIRILRKDRVKSLRLDLRKILNCNNLKLILIVYFLHSKMNRQEKNTQLLQSNQIKNRFSKHMYKMVLH